MPLFTVTRVTQTQFDDEVLPRSLRTQGLDHLHFGSDDIARPPHPLSPLRGIVTGLMICGPLWLLIWTGIAWLT